MQNNPFFHYIATKTPLQAGKLLVSTPLTGDVFFDRSVILLIEHNEEGESRHLAQQKFTANFKRPFSQYAQRTYSCFA
jgi:hypothetical protein